MAEVTEIRPSVSIPPTVGQASAVEVTNGWTQDEGKPRTRRLDVVLLTLSEDGTCELAKHMTPAEADRLAAELAAMANRVRRVS
ncbi:hypothetical protein DEJ00_01420 [Curtobacterium sp. MCLR17_039]|uniref:hypothetical protein n=1 Tax=Curtobacterium sp. MCLR17_039 TaxID=2175624 RepID=UPI000DA784E4|nr:hypothetical protein [Curtobacterium sp. MCLR17_039]PZE93906.1 hypothetical protein DEJ00_01420 [Curtobacterium sp. MCLR17_039]